MNKTCAICGSDFYVTGRRIADARFCSRTCKGKASRIVRTCEICDTAIYRRGVGGKRFCSLRCAGTARRNGRDIVCEQCGTSVYVQGNRADTARFCSTACQIEWQGRGKTTHTCKVCAAEFRLSPSFSTYRTPTYCSIPCRDADPDVHARLMAMNAVQQLKRTTKAEAAGYALLDALGVPYERQKPFMGKFTPDAVVESARLVVQFDGDYWHDRKGTSTEARVRKRVALDRSQDAYVKACGWRVIRFWESDLKADPVGCAERLRAALHANSNGA